jgi:hypothetical protein
MKPLIYVTRDIERALGKSPAADYFVIANKNAYAESVQKKFPDFVFLAEGNVPLDTYDILSLPDTQNLINENGGHVLVFKNTKRIEELCTQKKWNLLNPSADLAEKIENKISQVEWLGDAKKFLPLHAVGTVSDIYKKIYQEKSTGTAAEGIFKKEPFILQWAHSHTGEGTALIGAGEAGKKEFDLIKSKFPGRDVRVTQFVRGPVFTANVCVNATDILVGNISYQITGILPFTENPFSTVGNDWSLPHTILDEKNLAEFGDIAQIVGEKMRNAGWKGLFGIDCIFDEERNAVHLIEINARQPASTTYESQLQNNLRGHGLKGLTTFEAHIEAVLNTKKAAPKLIEINDGAQILERVTLLSQNKTPDDIKATIEVLRSKQYNIIEYENTKTNSDLLRIQSKLGIMETHNKFNARGKEILVAVSGIPETE